MKSFEYNTGKESDVNDDIEDEYEAQTTASEREASDKENCSSDESEGTVDDEQGTTDDESEKDEDGDDGNEDGKDEIGGAAPPEYPVNGSSNGTIQDRVMKAKRVVLLLHGQISQPNISGLDFECNSGEKPPVNDKMTGDEPEASTFQREENTRDIRSVEVRLEETPEPVRSTRARSKEKQDQQSRVRESRPLLIVYS